MTNVIFSKPFTLLTFMNFVNLISQIVQRMTSESLADEIRSKIKDGIKQISYYEQEDSDGVPDDHGTSHLSILAEDGSAVAVTSSINN